MRLTTAGPKDLAGFTLQGQHIVDDQTGPNKALHDTTTALTRSWRPESEQGQDPMSNNDGILTENLSKSAPPAVAAAIARIRVANNENLDQLCYHFGVAAGGVLPHNAWVTARANIEELKCVCGTHGQRLPRHKGFALPQSSADCLQEKTTSVSGGARLQGTYEHPSTGIATRWHTNSVMPIAKGARTCKSIKTCITLPSNTLPSTSFDPNQVQPRADQE